MNAILAQSHLNLDLNKLFLKLFDTLGVTELDQEIDLAYVHVNIEDMFYCLGQQLGYECDPCIDPFELGS